MRLAGFVKAAYQLHCSVAFAKQYNRILRRSNCVVGSTLVACVNFANSQPNQCPESFLHNTWAYFHQILQMFIHTATLSPHLLSILGSSSSPLPYLRLISRYFACEIPATSCPKILVYHFDMLGPQLWLCHYRLSCCILACLYNNFSHTPLLTTIFLLLLSFLNIHMSTIVALSGLPGLLFI